MLGCCPLLDISVFRICPNGPPASGPESRWPPDISMDPRGFHASARVGAHPPHIICVDYMTYHGVQLKRSTDELRGVFY